MRRGSLDQFEGVWAGLRDHYVVTPASASSAVWHAIKNDADLKVLGQIGPLLAKHIFFDPTDADASALYVWEDRPAEMLHIATGGSPLPPGMGFPPEAMALDFLPKKQRLDLGALQFVQFVERQITTYIN